MEDHYTVHLEKAKKANSSKGQPAFSSNQLVYKLR